MELEQIIEKLGTLQNGDTIVKSLQETTNLLLNRYCFSIEGITLYPIELESYFYRAGVFEDPYVHSNELQMNHFGEFYVHRRGQSANDAYKMDNRVCVGISLSAADTYYYSALIRSAVFADGTAKFGPNNVLTYLASKVNEQEHAVSPDFFNERHAGTFALSKLFPAIERRKVLQKAAHNADPRNKENVFFSSRIGIGDENMHYRNMQLRALIGNLKKEYQFKEKTLILKDYLQSKKLRGEEAAKEAKRVYGSAPKAVISQL